ncbi:hypothetical protein IMAU10566_01061 [Lactiplantibacillus plantarum]|nr:hypothetical protein [Lactiplantibacillus plantarum]
MVTTGNQTIARADNGEQAGVTATKQAATPQAPATQESVQASASQAVTSYATSQAVVASQAASQSITDTQSYAAQLAKDPAQTATQVRQVAADTKTATTSVANQQLTNATSAARQVQSQAVKTAQTDQATADQQAATTKSMTTSQAVTAKKKADAAALASKNNADQQAAATKNTAIKQAQSGKVDGKYAQAVINAQNQLDSDLDAVDEAEQNKATAYTATPASSTADSVTGKHDIQSEKNLPTSIINPNLSDNDTNNPDADAIQYYGETLKNDDSAVITGSLTDSQQNELADYAVTLVNSWRKAQGMNPIVWTKQAQDATIEVAKMREGNKLGMKHTAMDSNSYKELNNIADSNGISYEQENMSFLENYDNQVTMTLLKAQLANTITAMIYQDATLNWGHKNNFANMETMGFAAQKNNDSATSDIFSYVLVFDGYSNNEGTTPTVLTPTSAQTIEASRTTGGATKAQVQAVENDKAALANAQKALTDATNTANQSIATQLVNINDTYEKALRANSVEYQTRLSVADDIYKQAIASAEQTYSDALAKNAANKTTKLQQAQSAYETAIAKATAIHDATIKQAQQTYETAYANAHDETLVERAARHGKLLAAFEANETSKLATLKTKQAIDLNSFKAKQNQLVADFLASQVVKKQQPAAVEQDQQAHIQTGTPKTTTNKTIKELNTLPAKLQTTATHDGRVDTDSVQTEQADAVAVNLHTNTPKKAVSVLLPAMKSGQRDNRTMGNSNDQSKHAVLPQTDESTTMPINLWGIVLLGLLGLSYRGLRRKVR